MLIEGDMIEASPSRRRPWSMKTQVSCGPMARCISVAVTAESTPPDLTL